MPDEDMDDETADFGEEADVEEETDEARQHVLTGGASDVRDEPERVEGVRDVPGAVDAGIAETEAERDTGRRERSGIETAAAAIEQPTYGHEEEVRPRIAKAAPARPRQAMKERMRATPKRKPTSEDARGRGRTSKLGTKKTTGRGKSGVRAAGAARGKGATRTKARPAGITTSRGTGANKSSKTVRPGSGVTKKVHSTRSTGRPAGGRGNARVVKGRTAARKTRR
jgi:hypothetical protein